MVPITYKATTTAATIPESHSILTGVHQRLSNTIHTVRVTHVAVSPLVYTIRNNDRGG